MRLMSCELPIRVEVRTVGWFVNCLDASVLKNEPTRCGLPCYDAMFFGRWMETYRRKRLLHSSGQIDWKCRQYDPPDTWHRKRPVSFPGSHSRCLRLIFRPIDGHLDWGSLFCLSFRGKWLDDASCLATSTLFYTRRSSIFTNLCTTVHCIGKDIVSVVK
jgi:hypothetical protein